MINTVNLRLITCGMLLLLLTAEVSAQTPLVVAPGSDPAATLVGAVRFRNFSSAGTENEIWVGVPPLSAPPASEGADLPWDPTPRIHVSYRPDTGLLAANASTDPDIGVPRSLASAEKLIGNVGSLNYVEITITTHVPDAHIFVGGVLNPPGRTGFGTCPGCLLVGLPDRTPGTHKWKVTGVDLTEGFSFEGVVAASYLAAGGDFDFVEIAVGYVPPPDTTGPASSQLTVGPTPVLLNGDTTLTALVDDSAAGNNSISSAVYTLNGTTTGPLTVLDGSFDEPSELVQATLPATRLGINEVCVQATDSLDNTGPALCQQFIVTHKFTGFSSPIDNTLVNSAVAGQTIPARWRLADANDVPVSNPQTVQQLVSYQINCTDASEDSVDSIEEYAAGNNGLLYLGDGRWQFNWKTPASYANTCRAMYIVFANGATSPVAEFNFR